MRAITIAEAAAFGALPGYSGLWAHCTCLSNQPSSHFTAQLRKVSPVRFKPRPAFLHHIHFLLGSTIRGIAPKSCMSVHPSVHPSALVSVPPSHLGFGVRTSHTCKLAARRAMRLNEQQLLRAAFLQPSLSCVRPTKAF